VGNHFRSKRKEKLSTQCRRIHIDRWKSIELPSSKFSSPSEQNILHWQPMCYQVHHASHPLIKKSDHASRSSTKKSDHASKSSTKKRVEAPNVRAAKACTLRKSTKQTQAVAMHPAAEMKARFILLTLRKPSISPCWLISLVAFLRLAISSAAFCRRVSCLFLLGALP